MLTLERWLRHANAQVFFWRPIGQQGVFFCTADYKGMNCILSALQQRCLLYGFVLADVVISRTRQLPSIPIPPQRKFESTTVAAGAIYSTVEDMFLWDRALCTGQVLGKQYRDLMFRPNNEVPEVKAAGGRSRSIYGYGWQIYSRTP
ncbi:MAG: hypothetical protein VXZ82_19975 [Planctomycetota bacterium]|nr:hypothetical protein [Planctomycetota bacterium]